jgi:hypothetical protein
LQKWFKKNQNLKKQHYKKAHKEYFWEMSKREGLLPGGGMIA